MQDDFFARYRAGLRHVRSYLDNVRPNAKMNGHWTGQSCNLIRSYTGVGISHTEGFGMGCQ